MRPADVGLPYDEFNQFQEEAILATAMSDKPVVLLEAPTGAGKSGIVVGVANALNARKAAIVCHQIALQEQYLRDFPDLRTVRGRGNFPCLLEEVSADDAPCSLAGTKSCTAYSNPPRWTTNDSGIEIPNPEYRGIQSITCPYHRQLEEGLAARISVHNYAYWLPAANLLSRFTNLDLLFFDEAHVLERTALMDFIKVEITPRLTRYAGLGFPDFKQDHLRWRTWAAEVVKKLKEEAARNPYFGSLSPDEVRRIKAIRALYDRAKSLLTLDEDWIINQDKLRSSYTFKPVWSTDFGPKYVLGHARKTVFLSATILSKELFLEPLGIDPKDADFYRLRSTFPKENRPIILSPGPKVKRGMSDEDKKALVAKVDAICDRHASDKGLIHTTNYEIARLLVTESKHASRMMTHDSRNRSEILQEFKESTQPRILVSPSMTTGIDLPDDYCRFAIVAKLPFPDQGDEQIKRRMKLGPDGLVNPKGKSWADWTVACDLIQACGRHVRHKADHGKTYVVDGNITWFLSAIGGTSTAKETLLPIWFKEAITREEVKSSAMGDLLEYQAQLEVVRA
jgi:Rad3-related DNA helicase